MKTFLYPVNFFLLCTAFCFPLNTYSQQWSGNNDLVSPLSRTGSIAIGDIASPDNKLKVKNGKVLFEGEKIVQIKTYFNKTIWYEKAGAFRTGIFSVKSAFNIPDQDPVYPSDNAMHPWAENNAGIGSFAAGFDTKANGQYAAAFGSNTFAEASNSFAIGRYNTGGGSPTQWIATDPLFQIGIGSSKDQKSDALAVLKNGNVGVGISSPQTLLSLGLLQNKRKFALYDKADAWYGLGMENKKLIFQVGEQDAAFSFLNNVSKEIITIKNNGKVGIGTTDPKSTLAVNGKITAKEVEVTLEGWADFVFKENYKLNPLEEVEKFIKENNHLPDVPSEKTVLEKGVNLGEMDAILLRKIEELTLYIIDLKKENDSLKKILINNPR